jgi:hypothetical protein
VNSGLPKSANPKPLPGGTQNSDGRSISVGINSVITPSNGQ